MAVSKAGPQPAMPKRLLVRPGTTRPRRGGCRIDAVGRCGVRLAQALLQRWQELAIIVMSGYAEARLLRQAVGRGSIRFLQKPFPFALLEREMAAVLCEQGITSASRSGRPTER